MSANTSSEQVMFIDWHQPPLDSAVYEVKVSQQVSSSSKSPLAKAVPQGVHFEQTARFHVFGPRVVFSPGQIESRFPPQASGGEQTPIASLDKIDHAGVLPQVVLTESTMPWSRDAMLPTQSERTPWLAILLLTDAEFADAKAGQTTVADLRASSNSPAFPGLGTAEKGLNDSDPVAVLDVPRATLQVALPDASWLKYLTHVRERVLGSVADSESSALDSGTISPSLSMALQDLGLAISAADRVIVEEAGSEWRITASDTGRSLYLERSATAGGGIQVASEARAVVFSCRVAQPGKQHHAFLVSLEGRFDWNAGAPQFHFGAASGPNDLVRLVTLDQWSFTVDSRAARLESLLEGLVHAGNLNLANPAIQIGKLPGAAFGDGFSFLRHQLRNGGRTLSWYRGPFVPRKAQTQHLNLPVRVSDELLVQETTLGFFLTSYAAAWELGRQVTLANTNVALQLVQWKTARKQAAYQSQAAQGVGARLMVPASVDLPLPGVVKAWFQGLCVFEGVPFGYLVPDPAMLPVESLRYFQVELRWWHSLIDGAFSMGRVLQGDRDADDGNIVPAMSAMCERMGINALSQFAMTGCLIRSEVIAGWPELQIDAFRDEARAAKARLLRRAQLSDNVLLLLFDGPVARIDLHPNPEALHQGLEWKASPGAWFITPRALQGAPAPTATPMRDETVLDVGQACKKPGGQGEYTPSEFALRMLAGVPRLSVLTSPKKN